MLYLPPKVAESGKNNLRRIGTKKRDVPHPSKTANFFQYLATPCGRPPVEAGAGGRLGFTLATTHVTLFTHIFIPQISLTFLGPFR